MDDVLEVILDYIRWVNRHPDHVRDATTLSVVSDLRALLDAACPEWRWEVFRGDPARIGALEVEIVLTQERSVRGALAQRPSTVPGDQIP